MNLFFFTNTYPYGTGETFIESEINFLSQEFEKIYIFPLQQGKKNKRSVPDNVIVFDSLLHFSTKDKKELIFKGVFNLAPFGFALREFFSKKVFLSRKKIWRFFTTLLLYRSLYSHKKCIKKMKKLIKPEDILYFYWGDTSTFLLPKFKKIFPNKSFVRLHRTDIYEYANNGYIPFRKKVFPYIDYFIPISANGKNYLIEKYPSLIKSEKITLSRLGVHDHGLNMPYNNSENQNEFHLVSCSGLSPVKRVELIIDALAEIKGNVFWTHIGGGILMTDLQEKAKLLPQNIRVEWKGQMTNKEVINYYKNEKIDIFINVSSSEGLPVSIMEAMSFGIPVLATDVGGTSEIVNSGTGVLLPKEITAKELAKSIRDFMQKEQLSFRTNARDMWSKNYNANKNFQEFVMFLKQS